MTIWARSSGRKSTSCATISSIFEETQVLTGWAESTTLITGVLIVNDDWTRGRLALFACKPRGDKDLRMAMLWKTEVNTREALSDSFGYFTQGVKYLARYGDKLKVNKNDWTYLGPNTVTVKLMREKKVCNVEWQGRREYASMTHILHCFASVLGGGIHSSQLRQPRSSDAPHSGCLQELAKATRIGEGLNSRSSYMLKTLAIRPTR